jgi:benzylsuccinate CoA-transferase BbsF subunit
MGLPGWAEDEAFATSEGRYQQRTTVDERIAQWTKTQDAHELMMQCQAAGVPAGVVQDGADLAEHDPQLRLRGFLQPLDDVHPTLGPTWIDRLVIQFDATPCDDYQRVRAVGEDSGAILKDWLNLDDDSLNELTDAGVLS